VTQNGLNIPFKDQFCSIITDNESTEIKETARFSSISSTGSPPHTSASQQFRLIGSEQVLVPEAYDSSLWRADVALSQDITGKFPPAFLTFERLGFKVLSETKTLKFAPLQNNIGLKIHTWRLNALTSSQGKQK
jgi:hypothetical protein